MEPFHDTVSRWRDFFILSGTAAATLIGLLFVAISLRPDIRRARADTVIRTMVGHNFVMLLVVLLIALYFVVPDMGPDTLGLAVIVTAAVPCLSIIRDAFRCRRAPDLDRPTFWWSFIVPVIGLMMTMGIGVAFLINEDTEVSWFTTVVATFLVVPTKISWELLMVAPES